MTIAYRTLLASAAVPAVVLMLNTTACAQDVRTFDVAAGPLDSALIAYSRQSGQQVLYTSAQVAGRNLGPAVTEEGLGCGDPGLRINDNRKLGRIVVRKSLDLFQVEDGVGLQERDPADGILAAFVGLRSDQGIGIDDGRSSFALADMGPQNESLAEGHPGRGGEAPGGGFGPQQDDIDAAVGGAVMAKRAADGPSAGPGLRPGTGAGFQLGDDLLGDAGVDIGASGFVGARHGDLLGDEIEGDGAAAPWGTAVLISATRSGCGRPRPRPGRRRSGRGSWDRRA